MNPHPLLPASPGCGCTCAHASVSLSGQPQCSQSLGSVGRGMHTHVCMCCDAHQRDGAFLCSRPQPGPGNRCKLPGQAECTSLGLITETKQGRCNRKPAELGQASTAPSHPGQQLPKPSWPCWGLLLVPARGRESRACSGSTWKSSHSAAFEPFPGRLS